MGPIMKPDEMTHLEAAQVLNTFIFMMSMSDELNNTTLCLCQAMKLGAEALIREHENKEVK